MSNGGPLPGATGSEGAAAPAGGAASLPPLPPQLLASFPPGVNPETYKLAEVTGLLRKAAYFSLFSVHNPLAPNQVLTLPGNPYSLVGIKVNENTHRFDVRVLEPGWGGKERLRAANRVGQLAAHVHIDWRVIPEGFYAAPDRMPPPTPLVPTQSQRFTMMNGSFTFVDRDGSGIQGFGAGRTFPGLAGQEPVLFIGANIDALEGFGRLQGLNGNVVVNGYIRPPQDLFINVMLRVMDPDGKLLTDQRLQPLQPIPDPDPTSVYMTFLGEQDPDEPTTLNAGPGGLTGSNVHELLRLVHLSFDLGRDNLGLRSKTQLGPPVAKLAATLLFNPLNPATPGTAEAPVPYQTCCGEFRFFDQKGETFATITSNIVEGRAFATPLAGAPLPVYRMVGFGPLLQSTGSFAGVTGMLSMNGVVSVFPRTLSNLYIFRFNDPDGKFRAAIRKSWS